jgi:hypothetical protein
VGEERMKEKKFESETAIGDPWEDLVISILSVNQYSLERTYRCLEGLREQGLFDPNKLMHWGQADIVNRLKSARCDRGLFMTNLFALRLSHLGTLIQRTGIDASTKIISSRDAKSIEALLMPVSGVGPKVIANFCLLRNIDR